MKWISYKEKRIPEEYEERSMEMRSYVLQVKIPDQGPKVRFEGDYDILLCIGSYAFELGWICDQIVNENQIINYALISDIPKGPNDELEELRNRMLK